MVEISSYLAVCCFLVASRGLSSFTEAMPSTADIPASHFEPQVAMYCGNENGKGQNLYSQYMQENGQWTTDFNNKATCLKNKLEILEYCKKLYPNRDITNIVESSHFQRVTGWCKVGHRKCKGTHIQWVKPYRCLEGPFQSDALLVPDNCLFDHIHNQTQCWTFEHWNMTAGESCHERDLTLRSFAMLLPCGISLFSGVEFVCCPKHYKDNIKARKLIDLEALKGKTPDVLDMMDEEAALDEEEPDDDDEDDEDDEDEADEVDEEVEDAAVAAAGEDEEEDEYSDDDDSAGDGPTSTVASPPTPSPTQAPATSAPTQVPTPDPYFSHFDPRLEHQAFKEAQQRLEEMHREKVTKVMKDWSDLEERYQDMRDSDPKAADDFKKRMTLRFQKTVQALEEEGEAEKHQLVAMHQQRVMAHINQRKKEAMGCYTQALNDNPPNAHRVQKCLQKLLRSLHKDRHHTISHYRHLLASSFEQAEKEKALTLEHLTDIDRMVNQSLQMLDRYPELRTNIGQLMEDYIQALRSKDETPGSLLAMTRDAEAAILEKYRADVAARQEERERQKLLEKQRKQLRKKERTEVRLEKEHIEATLGANDKFDPETMEDEHVVVTVGSPEPPVLIHHEEEPRVAHAQTHAVGHGEPTFSIRQYHRESKNVYFTVAFGGIAVMAAVIVGIVVYRRRSARSPHSQGFVEVDQAATPEERHVANMQINGYENPTYKYFEVKE